MSLIRCAEFRLLLTDQGKCAFGAAPLVGASPEATNTETFNGLGDALDHCKGSDQLLRKEERICSHENRELTVYVRLFINRTLV